METAFRIRSRIQPLLLLAGACASVLGAISGSATSQADSPAVVPLRRAHAHNDYEHQRPLFDALERGFCSVEADVYLVDGQLQVAHTRQDLKPERTLEKLYLDPLRQRIRANGGSVYPGGPAIYLLVDVKTE